MILLFNGPPGSGKDEACMFFEKLGWKHLSFKFELFNATISYYQVGKKWFFEGYTREEKDVQSPFLDGLSRRESLIYVSEKVYKPVRGKDVWGQQLASNIKDGFYYCVSDLGFEEEIFPIINKIGAEKTIIVQLVRDGYDFSKDSRRYVQGFSSEEIVIGHKSEINPDQILPNIIPVRSYRIYNNGTIEQFREALNFIYEKEKNAKNKTNEEGIS